MFNWKYGPTLSNGRTADENDLSKRIPREGRCFVANGGYSSVHMGVLLDSDGTGHALIAIKTLRQVNIRAEATPQDRIKKRLGREMHAWKRLNHPNIVPLLGYILETQNEEFSASLVSPWYPNGSLMEYLKKTPNADNRSLCIDVASGLTYLHESNPSVVHGDIKCANILVDEEERAAICDFGLAVVLDDLATGYTSSIIGGTARFLAPELLEEDTRTTQSDVHAFGCVCAEILHRKQPYDSLKTEGTVLTAIQRGECPYNFEAEGVNLPIHELLRQCWMYDPLDRPPMKKVTSELEFLLPPDGLFPSSPTLQVVPPLPPHVVETDSPPQMLSKEYSLRKPVPTRLSPNSPIFTPRLAVSIPTEKIPFPSPLSPHSLPFTPRQPPCSPWLSSRSPSFMLHEIEENSRVSSSSRLSPDSPVFIPRQATIRQSERVPLSSPLSPRSPPFIPRQSAVVEPHRLSPHSPVFVPRQTTIQIQTVVEQTEKLSLHPPRLSPHSPIFTPRAMTHFGDALDD